MLEPKNNPNPSLMVDPPGLMRRLIAWQSRAVTNTQAILKSRQQAEARRRQRGEPHVVEYFHQLDDPYSHLSAQVLKRFAARYDVTLRCHLIRATGGANQPEAEKLAIWARRDAELVAPHHGLRFPAHAGITPPRAAVIRAARELIGRGDADFIERVEDVSHALWDEAGGAATAAQPSGTGPEDVEEAFDQGSARLKELGHYSGACFFYGGEWYWGVDRLFHLEARLQELGVSREGEAAYLVPRPDIDVTGVDASGLTLDFFPSLNSPYTSIIYDRTIAMKNACAIDFRHRPVLPMIMRGVPATMAKGRYILFDTKREADWFGVPFGPMITPIGKPTRDAYSLLPWATELGKDEALMSSLLACAFSQGVYLNTEKGMRRGVEAAGLDWAEAKRRLGDERWKPIVEESQDLMVEDLGLWGVPSFRLSGPDGEPDVAVWGQDRLWLIAAEIRRRATKASPAT